MVFFKRLLVASALSVSLSACASMKAEDQSLSSAAYTSSIDKSARADLSDLASNYQQSAEDPTAAINYAKGLTQSGRHEQAAAVLQQAVLKSDGNKAAMAAYGKSLIAIGRYEEAANVLAESHTADNPDWQVLSAQGVVADKIGEHEKARHFYQQALLITPGDPGVLTNLGLSYAMTKQYGQAEASLRQAAGSSSADARVFQNLAVVLSLQGKHQEAKKVLADHVPADQIEASMGYLKEMSGRSETMVADAVPAPTSAPKAKKRN
ncbi:tetratricopeptide repeat protein [Microvirga tunisiensis]|uniref:Tetratricopeptide repeat protein n=1 Tax=Microvirga tunisiensis TaxID=2108360 RepID=A0A5N7MBL0_9HYPH|nr:tetratricopeptide repeat protein [Microvirga tunisiensis]MPR08140.1 tetratricopeptide repeat protein [Microvirga tunisiensis]MPR24147.1 tetratricopeptide repeat protein [Microvirga tunisiensis]